MEFGISTNVVLDDGDKHLDIKLTLLAPEYSVTISPECPESITKVDIDAASGSLNSRPCNGAFKLSWCPATISLVVDKSGDGCGGSLAFVLKSSPALLQSLHAALKKWKDAVAAQ